MKFFQSILVLFLLVTQATSQDIDSRKGISKPKTAFEWLQQFEGTWKTPSNGKMVCRSIGKKWIVNEIEMTGIHSVQTLGFNSKQNKFVGSWIDSSSDYQWTYTGKLNSTGKKLILEATGPDFSNPSKMRRYRDIYEFEGKTKLLAMSQHLGEDGKWKTFNKSKMVRTEK